MSIDQAVQGKWCSLVADEPCSCEERTLLAFHDGMMVDRAAVMAPHRVASETLLLDLANAPHSPSNRAMPGRIP